MKFHHLGEDTPVLPITQIGAVYELVGNERGQASSISEDGDMVSFSGGKVFIMMKSSGSAGGSTDDYTLVHLVSSSNAQTSSNNDGDEADGADGNPIVDGNSLTSAAVQAEAFASPTLLSWLSFVSKAAGSVSAGAGIKYKQVSWSPRLFGSPSCYLGVLTICPQERLFIFRQKLGAMEWEPAMELPFTSKHSSRDGAASSVKAFSWCESIPFTNSFGIIMVAYESPMPHICLYQVYNNANANDTNKQKISSSSTTKSDDEIICVKKCLIQVGQVGCDFLCTSGWNLSTHPQTGQTIYFCRFASCSYASNVVLLGRIIVDPSQPDNILIVDVAQVPGIPNVCWLKFSPLADLLFVQTSSQCLLQVNLAVPDIHVTLVRQEAFCDILLSPFAGSGDENDHVRVVGNIPSDSNGSAGVNGEYLKSCIGLTVDGRLTDLSLASSTVGGNLDPSPGNSKIVTLALAKSSEGRVSPFGLHFRSGFLGQIFHASYFSYRRDLQRSFQKTLKLVNATFLYDRVVETSSNGNETDFSTFASLGDLTADGSSNTNNNHNYEGVGEDVVKLALDMERLFTTPMGKIFESSNMSHRLLVQSSCNVVHESYKILDYLMTRHGAIETVQRLLSWISEQAAILVSIESQALSSISFNEAMGPARFGFRLMTSSYFKFLKICFFLLRLLSERSSLTVAVTRTVLSRIIVDSSHYLLLQALEDKTEYYDTDNNNNNAIDINEKETGHGDDNSKMYEKCRPFWEKIDKFSSFSGGLEKSSETLHEQLVEALVCHGPECPFCQAKPSVATIFQDLNGTPTITNNSTTTTATTTNVVTEFGPTLTCSNQESPHTYLFCPLTLRASKDPRDWYCRECKTPETRFQVSGFFGNVCFLCGCNYVRDFR